MAWFDLEISKQRYGKIIKELGEKYRPIQTSFKFEKKGIDYFTSFKDLDGDKVDIKFEAYRAKCYEVGFAYGREGVKFKDVPMDHYLRIIYTVIAAVKQFLNEYDPGELKITGQDKTKTDKRSYDEQKVNIYLTIASHNIDDAKYKIHISGNILYVDKIDFEKQKESYAKLQERFEYVMKIIENRNKK